MGLIISLVFWFGMEITRIIWFLEEGFLVHKSNINYFR